MGTNEVGTPESDALCREVAEKSGGVCVLAFSRGKDALAAWIQLRRFFRRIIPYHLASVPGLSWADESLAYYERVFSTPILRLMSENSWLSLSEMLFQPIEDEPAIEALDIWEYSRRNILDRIRVEHRVPDAWAAYGLNASDSIERRVFITQYKGRIESNFSFNPCWDWSREAIISTVRSQGISLPKDYLMGNRTCVNVPNLQHLYRMEQLFPADFAKVEEMFPFIRATMARNEFRRLHGMPSTDVDPDEPKPTMG